MTDEEPRLPEGIAYDYDGNPITDLVEIGRLSMLPEKLVERTEVGDRIVSTVWVGTDGVGAAWRRMYAREHPGEPLPPPLIYETALLAADGSYITDLARWPTRDAARAGHDQVVAAVRAGELPD